MNGTAEALESARAALQGLMDINAHLGYQFTEPLALAVDRVTQAIEQARQEEREACALIADKYGEAAAAWDFKCNAGPAIRARSESVKG